MLTTERIQAAIHQLEVGGARRLNYFALAIAVLALGLWYDTHCYRNFSAPEAMDAAQVARNLAEGKGFSTDFIRPFSVYLLQKHNRTSGGSAADRARLNGPHPDLANAPLWPMLLAGFWKIHEPDWTLDRRNTFWSESGRFIRYKPEFFIAVVNQILLLAAVLLTFLVARTIFDTPAAWLSALIVLGSDTLWKFSVSGLPTLLLLVIFLGLVWCLALFERLQENPNERKKTSLAVAAGLLVGLGMLTRYSVGWVIVPVFVYFAVFGGPRRTGLALTAFLVFAALASPWIIHNLAVSGTFFGTAGYSVLEGTFAFPNAKLMKSLTPDMTSAYWVRPYLVKLVVNLRIVLQDDVPRLGGSWIGILFLAGLLLGLRNVVARRLRYFTLMCLGVFIVVSALGRTQFTAISPESNTENPLVLLTPLVVIFGVAFFLTLLNQINAPLVQVRYAVVALVGLLACQPFIMTLLPPAMPPTVFPPYYPPDIQKFDEWIQPNELMMSDLPWAVAWYGERQCAWTTINHRYEFSQFNDYVKHVSALYLGRDTLDAKLFTDCIQGAENGWSRFVFEIIAVNKIQVDDPADTWGKSAFRPTLNRIPENFPLRELPLGVQSGLFLTDRVRWQTE